MSAPTAGETRLKDEVQAMAVAKLQAAQTLSRLDKLQSAVIECAAANQPNHYAELWFPRSPYQ